jgi:hypothetical protein
LMAAATMASLPPPPTTMTATLDLITLALPWTRIGQRGGGRTMTRLICCHHGHCCWCHLCLHLLDNGAKDNGRGDRRGHHANIRSHKEVEHHNPIGVEQQKQKQKQTQKQKQKQKQQQCRQCHRLCTCRQLCPCSRRCCLSISRGSSGGSRGVLVAAAGLLRV